MVRARGLLLHALAFAAALIAADSASGAGFVSSQSFNGTTQVSASLGSAPQGGGAPSLTVTGTAAGRVTFTEPAGLSTTSPNCAQVTSTKITCGGLTPVDWIQIDPSYAGPTSVVDLSGLAQRSTLGGPWQGGRNADYAFSSVGEFREPYVVVRGYDDSANTVIGGPASAVYELGRGNDTVIGGTGDEMVVTPYYGSADGSDTYHLGGGFDIVSYARVDDPVDGSLGAGTTSISVGADTDQVDGAEALIGGSGNDTLSITGRLGDRGTLMGNGGDDSLTGGDGPDYLIGGFGSDTVAGGAGDDRLFGYGPGGTFSTPSTVGRDRLDGGPGADELVIGGRNDPLGPYASDDKPVCGPGDDVLRADADIDEGVSRKTWPADCEFMASVAYGVNAEGSLEVGQTLTVDGPEPVAGSPITGRVAGTTWNICHPGVPMCEARVGQGASITLLPTDLGALIMSVSATLSEPLSGDPRWVAFRQSPAFFPQTLYGGPSELGTVRAAGDHCITGSTYPFFEQYPSTGPCQVCPDYPTYPGYPEYPEYPHYPNCPTTTPTETPAPTPTPAPTGTPAPTPAPPATPVPTPGPAPTPGPKADAKAVAAAIRAALGKKTVKLSALGKSKVVTVVAPSGSVVRVAITLKKGKRTVLLSRGAAVTARSGKAALKLVPTKAGRKAAKGKKRLTVSIGVTVTPPGGKPVTTTVKVKVNRR